ncbi:MAG: enoyl-CoA hydratase/isomerase family protein [Myxococcota bacterium]|nr:enoyl-CoA hydratase/isomerase family protein [Myxococcota bacterium]
MNERFIASGFTCIEENPAGFQLWQNDQGLMMVALNNPPVNSLSRALITALDTTLKELEQAPPKALIWTSTNPRVFSAGLDVKELIDPDETAFKSYWAAFESLWKTSYLFPSPTVAMLAGAAPAGGTVLALCCDYRYATSRTKLGLTEVAIGMVPPQWLIAMAERTLGPRQAELVLQGGQVLAAPEALDVGYIDAIVEPDEILARCIAQAEQFAQTPATVRAETKRRQRSAVADFIGPTSVDAMWAQIPHDPFQSQLKAMMARLKK